MDQIYYNCVYLASGNKGTPKWRTNQINNFIIQVRLPKYYSRQDMSPSIQTESLKQSEEVRMKKSGGA